MSWAFMSRPERRVLRADPVKQAALAAKLRDIGRIPKKTGGMGRRVRLPR
jgi:hypothetical protein